MAGKEQPRVGGGGAAAAKLWGSILASHPAAPGSILGIPKSGQRLENVDRTHLVLASGKLVLQKTENNLQSKKTLRLTFRTTKDTILEIFDETDPKWSWTQANFNWENLFLGFRCVLKDFKNDWIDE